MKYVCLVYLVEKDMSAMTKRESDVCTQESLAYDHTLRKAGHLILAHALQPVETATTIRVRNGKVFSTDGPFAEGATGRVHADRGAGPQRGHPGGGEDADGQSWQHRGATDQRDPALRRR